MEKLEENKKTLIGYYVKNEELYKIANIITNKALRVIETKRQQIRNKYNRTQTQHKKRGLRGHIAKCN